MVKPGHLPPSSPQSHSSQDSFFGKFQATKKGGQEVLINLNDYLLQQPNLTSKLMPDLDLDKVKINMK